MYNTGKSSIVKLTREEIKRLEAVRTLADLIRKYAQQMIADK